MAVQGPSLLMLLLALQGAVPFGYHVALSSPLATPAARPDTIEVVVPMTLLGGSRPLHLPASVMAEATQLTYTILNRNRDRFTLARYWDHAGVPLRFDHEHDLYFRFPSSPMPGMSVLSTGMVRAMSGVGQGNVRRIASVVVDTTMTEMYFATPHPPDPLDPLAGGDQILPEQATAYRDSGWTVETVVSRRLDLTIVVHPAALRLRGADRAPLSPVRQMALTILIALHYAEPVLRAWGRVQAPPLDGDAVNSALRLLDSAGE